MSEMVSKKVFLTSFRPVSDQFLVAVVVVLVVVILVVPIVVGAAVAAATVAVVWL